MTNEELNTLKFPIGKFKFDADRAYNHVNEWKETIEQFPHFLAEELENLSHSELSWKYRDEGWNIAQLVHHCADSHMNAFIRFKLALSELEPTIKPYFEERWAEMPDSDNFNIHHSLLILKGVHARWSVLLHSMKEADFEREYHHPEHKRNFSLIEVLAMYDWHCKHHLEHIKLAKKAAGAFT